MVFEARLFNHFPDPATYASMKLTAFPRPSSWRIFFPRSAAHCRIPTSEIACLIANARLSAVRLRCGIGGGPAPSAALSPERLIGHERTDHTWLSCL
jgi:hypothetical protein